jgi:3-hydroxyisobutyrate dehydrogenase
MITFIGMGLLGSNFAKAMLQKGEPVNVWNRTAAKAKALEPFGAKAYDNIADAVKGAERIHLILTDDRAVDEMLEKARAGFSPGVIIIDHSTTSTKGAAQRTEQWKKQGYTYLHAPVFMGPQNALKSTGYMLVSGDQDVIKNLEPVLSAMTGKLLNLGTETNRAAGVKLLGNSFLLFLTAGLSDTLALAQAMNIPSSDLVSLFDHWNPGAMVPGRLKSILAGDFDNPSWELNMARKDAGLMIEEANNSSKHLAAIPAIAVEMDKWISKGYGHSDWTVISKDNL